MNELDYRLEKITDKLGEISKQDNTPQFSEVLNPDTEFSESFKELGLMAVGGAIAPIANNAINKFVPIGNLGAALAGLGLKFMVKNNTVQNIANGLIIASLSGFVSNLLAGKLGFGEGMNDENESFSEQRVGAVNFG